MKRNLLNAGLLLSSLIGYLEWGQGSHTFLFQAEVDILGIMFRNPAEALHPFTVLPMLGQTLLLLTLFQKQPNKVLTYAGIGCIGILLLLVLFIGIIGPNFRMIASALPFIILAVWTILENRKQKKAAVEIPEA